MSKFKDDGNNIKVGILKAEAQCTGQTAKTLSTVTKIELDFRQAHATAYSQLAFDQSTSKSLSTQMTVKSYFLHSIFCS